MGDLERPSRRTAAAAAGGAGGAALGLVLSAAPALAHGGSTADGVAGGAAHPLGGVDHLLAMVAVGALAAAAATTGRRRAWSIPVGFVAGMVAGAALGLLGVAVPGIELLIAGSVLVLGLLVGVGRRGGRAWLPAVAVAMGAVHGVAHGAEAPGGGVPVAFLAGVVLVTAVLHGLGAVVGTGLRGRPAVRTAAGAAVAACGAVLLVAG